MSQNENEITEKRCTLCKAVKPIAEFISDYRAGYATRCKPCRERGQRAHAKYIDKNREWYNEYQRDYVAGRKKEKPDTGKRICTRCLQEFDLEQFRVRTDGNLGRFCVACRAYYAMHQAAWRKRNPDTAKAQSERAKQRQQEKRRKCFEHYGLACACCGESHYEFLALDHEDGGGGVHRRELHPGAIYGWLIKNNFPPGFRTLCWNCNWSYGAYGFCPHQKEKQLT